VKMTLLDLKMLMVGKIKFNKKKIALFIK